MPLAAMGRGMAAKVKTAGKHTIRHIAHDAARSGRRVGRPVQGPDVAVGANLQVHPVFGWVGLRGSCQDLLRLHAKEQFSGHSRHTSNYSTAFLVRVCS